MIREVSHVCRSCQLDKTLTSTTIFSSNINQDQFEIVFSFDKESVYLIIWCIYGHICD